MSGDHPQRGSQIAEDPLERLRKATPARVGLGRCGHGLPTRALLEFQLAHARARDAVHEELDLESLVAAVAAMGPTPAARSPTASADPVREATASPHAAASPTASSPIVVRSRAPDRQTYLQRPDLGRRLSEVDAQRLTPGPYEAALVIADGLSARAVQAHAAPLLRALFDKSPDWRGPDWRFSPIVIATQARVALGDEIGARLGAELVAVLIGERPGLSSPDSLGIYLTWHPRPGRQDSERNCISNIRPPTGLPYELAARRLAWLMSAARHQRLTGVRLKDPDLKEPGLKESGATGPLARNS